MGKRNLVGKGHPKDDCREPGAQCPHCKQGVWSLNLQYLCTKSDTCLQPQPWGRGGDGQPES